jgi:hypothetical protein
MDIVAEMRSFEFAVAEGKTPAEILEQAREEARKAGIAMQGDATSGSFRGAASGTYAVDGRRLKVEVTEKPGFVPWKWVESALQRLFS